MIRFAEYFHTTKLSDSKWIALGLWGALWLSISPGEFAQILNPSSLIGFLNGLRTILPFIALSVAIGWVAYNLQRRKPSLISIFNPLTMLILYGLIGMIAAYKSPDSDIALRWASLYISVPIVLLAIVWNGDASIILSKMIKITWLVIAVASVALFFVALFKLNLYDRITEPSLLLECGSGGWYDITNGKLRDTGVGRYAAITALICISGLWQPKWRPLAIAILILSSTLLLFSGARGAFAGFTAGAALMILIYGGKKALILEVIVVGLLIIGLFGTTPGQKFMDVCILRSTPPSSEAPVSKGSQQYLGPSNEPIPTSTPDTRLGVTHVNSEGPQTTPVDAERPQTATADSERPQTIAVAPSEKRSDVSAEKPVHLHFFQFTGRTEVWKEGFQISKKSPLIGFGFHADRLKLGTHMHNSIMQTLIQAGILGLIPFISAIVMGWILVFKLSRNLSRFPATHRHLIIQSCSVLAFFTLRSFPESTGAFFGVDWLILASILLYIHVMHKMSFTDSKVHQ